MASKLNFYQRMQTVPKSKAIGMFVLAAFMIGGGRILAQDKLLMRPFYLSLVVGFLLGGIVWYIGTRMSATAAATAKSARGSLWGTFLGVVGGAVFFSAMRISGITTDTIMIPLVGVVGAFLLVVCIPVVLYGKSGK